MAAEETGKTRMTGEEARIVAQVRARRAFGMQGDNSENVVVAYETMLDELGSRSTQAPYYLSEAVRDVMIVHCRKDAAHGLLNSISILDRMRVLRMLLWCNLGATVAFALLAIATLRGWI